MLLKDKLGFEENQQKATFRLGYQLALTRNKDDAVIDKAGGIVDARIKIDHIHWHVPHYTPPIQQQGVISKQTSRNTPTERRFIERSVFF